MGLKKVLVYISAFCLVIFSALFLTVSIYALSHRKNASNYYKQGLSYYQKEDYQNAYYNFSKILPLSELYLNALYRQAKSAEAIGDIKTAIEKYSIFEKLVNHENITPYALWRLGKLKLEINKKNDAKKVFLKLKKKFPNSEYGIAANYELSKLTNKPNEKKEYLLEYIKYSPNGKFAKDVLITMLTENIPLDFAQKTVLANCLYENGAYRRAVDVLSDVPLELSWVYLMKSLDKLNSAKNILKVGERGFSLTNSYFDEETLDEALSIYLKYYPEGAQIGVDKVYKEASDLRIRGLALYKSALLSSDMEKSKRLANFYENYPDSKYTPYVLHGLFLESLKQNKTILALKYAKIHASRYKNRDTSPSILYYTALFKKKAMDSSYKDALNRLVSEYPTSYYTYRAYSSLINKNFTNRRNLEITTKNTFIDFPYKDDKTLSNFLVNFASQGDYKPFEDFRINDPLIRSWMEYKKGNRALSSVLARDYLNSSPTDMRGIEMAGKLAYPVYYAKFINKYAKERNLNPYLILSLMKEESHFNPDIRSGVGATGLMQIMPSTAEMISGKSYTSYELTDEELNIDLGTKYFAGLMEIFSNNEALCVLSYNSGPNAVKKWLEKTGNLPFDIMVENIPYNETKTYIKKVYTAYWNYLMIYEGIKL